jgi:hypothetical protein
MKNQNDTKVPYHPNQNGYLEKQATNTGKDVGKGTLIHCWWECKLVQPLWKSECMFSKN